MIIIQINYTTRVIEKVYNNINLINTDEYDIKKILMCCRGEYDSYGGKYSENGIWRFANDLPYLDGEFNFYDRDIFNNKIQIPGNVDTIEDNIIEYSYTCDKSLKHDERNNFSVNYTKNNKIMQSMRNNALFKRNMNYFKDAIAQMKNNVIVRIYPNISCIPEYTFCLKMIQPVLNNEIVEYNGYIWIRYSIYFNQMKKFFNFN